MKRLILTETAVEFLSAIEGARNALIRISLVEGLLNHLCVQNDVIAPKKFSMKTNRKVDKIIVKHDYEWTALTAIMAEITKDRYLPLMAN